MLLTAVKSCLGETAFLPVLALSLRMLFFLLLQHSVNLKTLPDVHIVNQFHAFNPQREMFTKKRDPDKPKKPATAYFLFLEDFRKKMKGIPLEPGKRLTVICGEEWNKLTDQQKKPYQDQVAIKYQLYEEAMREWRLKVRGSGRISRRFHQTLPNLELILGLGMS